MPTCRRWPSDCAAIPAVEQVAAFGNALHVTGSNRDALKAALAPMMHEAGREVARSRPGLEDVFIHLMRDADDAPATAEASTTAAPKAQAQMNGGLFSFSRWLGIVGKEFIQLKRDRLTFAMIVGIPVVQLVLFGFAINSDPKRLPTALLVADRSEFSRSILAGLQNSSYFDFIGEAKDEDDADRMLAVGKAQFVVSIPADFSRRLVRGERPAMLIEADATDPTATGNAHRPRSTSSRRRC